MKVIYRDWDKIVFGLLLCIFVVSLFLFSKEGAAYQNTMTEKEALLNCTGESRNRREPLSRDSGNALLKEIEEGALEGFAKSGKRNIFSYPRSKKSADSERDREIAPVLEVQEIGYKPLEIEYRGRIVFEDGTLIAQVNFHDRSYLVSIGSRIAHYTVRHLTKRSISLQGSHREVTKIPYRTATYSDELIATIKEHTSGRTLTVGIDSVFFGYKVLDIDEDYVLVSRQGQHLRLEKGMVH